MPTSGKSATRRAPATWARQVELVCDEHGLAVLTEHRVTQAGKPAILRVRGLDAELAPEGGVAVLTLYATGSWTWGGDADAVAHAREPLDRAGVLR
jgi:hypothetical protein